MPGIFGPPIDIAVFLERRFALGAVPGLLLDRLLPGRVSAVVAIIGSAAVV